MEKEMLFKTLEKYERDFEESETSKNPNDITTIINDINRSDFEFSKFKKDEQKIKFFLFILQKSFTNLPIVYYQGMMDVASILIDLYFSDLASSTIRDSKNEIYFRVKCEDITLKDKSIYEKILDDNLIIYRKYENALVNVLNEKFLYLTKDSFAKYNQLNKKFVLILKSVNKDFNTYVPDLEINEKTSFVYMNHTLTFFKRLAGNSDVIYTIFNLILNSDPSMIFCILIFYLKKASQFTGSNVVITNTNKSKYLISNVSEEDIKKILKIHEFFLKDNFILKDSGVFIKRFIFVICLGVLVFAIIMSNYKQ